MSQFTFLPVSDVTPQLSVVISHELDVHHVGLTQDEVWRIITAVLLAFHLDVVVAAVLVGVGVRLYVKFPKCEENELP